MLCAVVRRTSCSNAHPSKTKSILVLRGPNCLLQGAKSLVQWALLEMQFPKEMQFLTGLGGWALLCSGTWVPDAHWCFWGLSTEVFLRLEVSVGMWRMQFSHSCMASLFVLFFLLRLYNSAFSAVWKSWLLACALYTYIQEHFLEQFSCLALTCQLSTHGSLTTWTRKNSIFSLWRLVTKTREISHAIPMRVIRYRRQKGVWSVSVKHLHPICCSQILCVMWENALKWCVMSSWVTRSHDSVCKYIYTAVQQLALCWWAIMT